MLFASAFWFATGILNVFLVTACVALAVYVFKAVR